MIAPMIPAQSPSTWKPGTTAPTIHSATPLTTKRNKPRVRMMNGSESTVRIGLTIAFTMPKTSAAISNAVVVSACTPLYTSVNSQSASAFSKKPMISCTVTLREQT